MGRRRGRSGLSPAARTALWERWRRGERLTDITTHLERTARFVALVKVNSKDAQHLARRLQRSIWQLPTDLTKP